MGFLKTIIGKIVAGLMGLAVVLTAISWWRAEPATRDAILSDSGRILEWIGVVLVLPWLGFALVGRVARLESNLAGAVLVSGLTLAEVALVAWLFRWNIAGHAGWVFLILGGLVAGLYNLLACDWIAERVG